MMAEPIDLMELFFAMLAGWKLILLGLLAGAFVMGAYYHYTVGPVYQADAKMYVSNLDSGVSESDLRMDVFLADDYTDIVQSRTTFKKVIENLGLNCSFKQLMSLVSVKNLENQHMIQVVATCDDVELCIKIANEVVNVGSEQIYNVVKTSEPTVIEYAEAAAVRDLTPSLTSYLMKGGILGAGLVCAILALKVLLDTSFRSEDDIEKYLHLPLLATVPYFEEEKGE